MKNRMILLTIGATAVGLGLPAFAVAKSGGSSRPRVVQQQEAPASTVLTELPTTTLTLVPSTEGSLPPGAVEVAPTSTEVELENEVTESSEAPEVSNSTATSTGNSVSGRRGGDDGANHDANDDDDDDDAVPSSLPAGGAAPASTTGSRSDHCREPEHQNEPRCTGVTTTAQNGATPAVPATPATPAVPPTSGDRSGHGGGSNSGSGNGGGGGSDDGGSHGGGED